MESIFDKQHNQLIIERIHKLSPASQAKWGKMNVAQMMAHCNEGLKVTFGEKKLKQSIFGFLFGKAAKKMLATSKPFKPNLPTAKEYVMQNEKEFEKEKNTLIDYVSRAAAQGPEIITKEKHPFFGKMTLDEWDKLQVKHLNHHLTQFGV